MNKSTTLAGWVAAVALVGVSTVALAQYGDSRNSYKAANDAAEADYKAARASCNSLSGNGKAVCVAEAKAARSRGKAEAEAQYKGTAKARTSAIITAADGDYAVARAKCGAMAGNAKDVCIQEAKADHTRAMAVAKSNLKTANARADAREDVREAEYKVARERCQAFAGAAKDNCVNMAKAQFGK